MNTPIKKENPLLRASTRQELESKFKRAGIIVMTAATLFTACSTPKEKVAENERVLKPKIVNFNKVKADALAAEKKYNEAKAGGDILKMETQEKQMNHLREVAIKKAEEIITLQEENTKLGTKQMDQDEKKAKKADGKTRTITREDALKFTP